jgi:hypothetical protein
MRQGYLNPNDILYKYLSRGAIYLLYLQPI